MQKVARPDRLQSLLMIAFEKEKRYLGGTGSIPVILMWHKCHKRARDPKGSGISA